jgi:alpha-beta hydrolase superfamily lysophospholipase
VPALLLQAGKEQVVSNRAEDRAAKAMRDCRKVVVADANHVIMHETDPVRNQALTAIRSFIEEQTK